jgi:hypothetical protein
MIFPAVHGHLIVAFAVPKKDIAVLLHQMVARRKFGTILPSRKAFVARWTLIRALFGV